MRIRSYIYLIFALFLSQNVLAKTVALNSSLIANGCESLFPFYTAQTLKISCLEDEGIFIETNNDLEIDGKLDSKHKIIIVANSIKIQKESQIKVDSLILESTGDIELNGKLSLYKTQIKTQSELRILGDISSHEKAYVYAKKILIQGRFSNQLGSKLNAQDLILTSEHKNGAQVVSTAGIIEAKIENDINLINGLLFSRYIRLYSTSLTCDQSRLRTTGLMLVRLLEPEGNGGNDSNKSNDMKFTSCDLSTKFANLGDSIRLYQEKYNLFLDLNWGIAGPRPQRDDPKRDEKYILLYTKGNIELSDTRITPVATKAYIQGKKVTGYGGAIGYNGSFSSSDIEIRSEIQNLDSYVAGENVNLLQIGKKSDFNNSGLIYANNVKTISEGSFSNRGRIKSTNNTTVMQNYKDGKLINSGHIAAGENLYLEGDGVTDYSKGTRTAGKLIDIANHKDSVINPGKVNTKDMYIARNWNSDQIKEFSGFQDQLNVDSLVIHRNSIDPKDELKIKDHIKFKTNTNVALLANNVKLLPGGSVSTKGDLDINAIIGNVVLSENTKLKSEGKVLVFAGNTIQQLAKVVGSGSSAALKRSEIFSGNEGVSFQAENYYGQAPKIDVQDEGTVTFDINKEIQIVPIEHEYTELVSKRKSIWGTKRKYAVRVKYFNPEINAKQINGVLDAEKSTLVNTQLNGNIISYDLNEEHFNRTKHTTEYYEDQEYFYKTYSANLSAHIVRAVVTAVAYVYGGPAGGAAASTLTETLVSGENHTLDSAIKSFAVNYAAMSVASSYGAVSGSLTRIAADKAINNRNYTFKESLAMVATAAASEYVFKNEAFSTKNVENLSVGEIYLQKFYENATYKVINQIINKDEALTAQGFLKDISESALIDLVHDLALIEATKLKQQQSLSYKEATKKLDPIEKAKLEEIQQAFVDILNEVQEKSAQDFYGKSYNELTDTEKANSEFINQTRTIARRVLKENQNSNKNFLADAQIFLINENNSDSPLRSSVSKNEFNLLQEASFMAEVSEMVNKFFGLEREAIDKDGNTIPTPKYEFDEEDKLFKNALLNGGEDTRKYLEYRYLMGLEPIMYNGEPHYIKDKWKIVDINGNFVSEVGIDTPILDPIDLIPTTAILRAIAKRSLLKFSAKETGEVLARESAEAVDTAQRIGVKTKEGTLKLGKHLSADKISPFDLNPTHKITMGKRTYQTFKEQLKQDGVVRETIKYIEYKGQKYIVDGHHRARVAKELGFKVVPVEKVELPFKGYKNIDDVLAGGN